MAMSYANVDYAGIRKRDNELQQRAFANQRAVEEGRAPIYEMSGTGYTMPDPNQTLLSDLIKRMTAPAPAAADPYGKQLSSLMKNPGEFSSSPVFKYAQDAGLEAANRTMASKGMLNSGNRLLELQKEGQGLASQNFFKMAELLGGLSSRAQAQQTSNSADTRGWASLLLNQANQKPSGQAGVGQYVNGLNPAMKVF